MKTIELEPTEFYEFRKIAFFTKLTFFCKIVKGIYFIEADKKELTELGY